MSSSPALIVVYVLLALFVGVEARLFYLARRRSNPTTKGR